MPNNFIYNLFNINKILFLNKVRFYIIKLDKVVIYNIYNIK